MKAKTTPASVLVALLLTTPLALLAQSDSAADKKTSQVELPEHAKPNLIKSMEPSPLPRAATADQTTAAKLVYGLLSDSRYAYRPVALDDTLSADIYKRYLESLDGGKQFFTAEDIAKFDAYKLKFDDAIKSGDLAPAYAIFSTYKQRVDQRVGFARNLLKQDIFDFTGTDRYEYDREDAPWATDNAALDGLWKASVRNDWLRLKLAGKKPEDIRKTLDKRYANMGKSIAELKGEDVFQTFLNSYANSVDPHTDYFTPKTADNFNVSMSLSLEGIGAVLQKQDDVVAIREIVPGGPAGKSGKLKPGDRVVGVGQGESGAMEDVIGWRIDDVVAKIRGNKGTKVRLDVIPAEAGLDSQPQRLVLVRDKVRLEDQAAKSKVITMPGKDGAPEQRIGVIELPGFYQDFEGRRKNSNDYASATRDVAKLLEKLRGEKVDGVVPEMRGNKGTKVRLDVIPAEAGLDSQPQRLVLVRDKVRLEDQAAKSKVITIPGKEGAPEQRIGVIELPGFYQDFEGRRKNSNDYASATRDVAKLLEELRGKNVDGVVLDLRNNGGGSLNEAIELTGLFIDRGPVVQVRESGGRVSVEGDSDTGIAWEGPLAVLINRGSASASEIFAGAIQDYGRGLVIGETSFGKGTVQNLVDLDRWPANEEARFGQVKLTIAQFFRVSGGSTQNKGVVPDVAFPVSVDASEYGESTYDNALPWTRISAVPHTTYGNFSPLLPKLESLHTARIAGDKEFQWWSDDVAQFREERAKKWVSLNEAERRAERDREETKRKSRQEQRKALGLDLDPLADDYNDDGLAANERDIAKDAEREKLADKRPDPLLRESAAILADAVRLLNNDRQLSAQVLPTATTAGHWAD